MASSSRYSVHSRKHTRTSFVFESQASSCNDNLQKHRTMPLDELDKLIVSRNDLQETIDEATYCYEQSENQILAQIDQWQRKTIQQVNQAAEFARQQVNQIASMKWEKIHGQFRMISHELKRLRDTEYFVQENLARLRNEIDLLNDVVTQSIQLPPIELNMSQSDKILWNRMIYVEEKPIYINEQRWQAKSLSKHFK